MSRKRYVIECIWSGYNSGQSRPCHRTVTIIPKAWDGLHTISFTDGTTMDVSIRECKPREKVKELKGYVELLNKFAWNKELCSKGYVSVMDVN